MSKTPWEETREENEEICGGGWAWVDHRCSLCTQLGMFISGSWTVGPQRTLKGSESGLYAVCSQKRELCSQWELQETFRHIFLSAFPERSCSLCIDSSLPLQEAFPSHGQLWFLRQIFALYQVQISFYSWVPAVTSGATNKLVLSDTARSLRARDPRFPWIFSSVGWTAPALSTNPHGTKLSPNGTSLCVSFFISKVGTKPDNTCKNLEHRVAYWKHSVSVGYHY